MNSNNEQQYCKVCEKNFPSSSFTSNGKSYRTCNNCRTQNKGVYQRKLENSADAAIEFHDFYDYFANNFDLFEKEQENKENDENNNNSEFKVSCIVNIDTLEGNSKEKAGRVIEIISDIDEYTWM